MEFRCPHPYLRYCSLIQQSEYWNQGNLVWILADTLLFGHFFYASVPISVVGTKENHTYTVSTHYKLSNRWYLTSFDIIYECEASSFFDHNKCIQHIVWAILFISYTCSEIIQSINWTSPLNNNNSTLKPHDLGLMPFPQFQES